MKRTIRVLVIFITIFCCLIGCNSKTVENRTTQIPEDGIINSAVFETIKKDDDIGIFNGNSNDITYQWLFMGSLIDTPKDENLLVNFSNAKTEDIKKQCSAKYVQEFSFSSNELMEGRPTLSVFFAYEWDVDSVDVYNYSTEEDKAVLIGSASVENIPNAVVTFVPNEHSGLFYLVGKDGQVEEKENSDENTKVTPTVTITPTPGEEYRKNSANNDSYDDGNSNSSGSNDGDSDSSNSDSGGMVIDPNTGKDKYSTDPVPEGKPEPVNTEDAVVDKTKSYTATLSIDCKTILDNMDIFNEDKLSVLPADGVIMNTRTVVFYEGENVFDVLKRETAASKIHMEFSWTPIYGSVYVEGIHNLYEFDCGELSGWMYQVNGWYPNYGASRYILKNGDVIEWRYTCDLGRDVGCDWDLSAGV